MVEHLRHRSWLRFALVVLAPLLGWSQWSAEPGVNAFVGIWVVAVITGVLGSTFPGWRQDPGARTSRLPVAVQGVLAGAVLGAFGVLLAEGSAPVALGGFLFALPGVFDDLVRTSWRRHRSQRTSPVVSH